MSIHSCSMFIEEIQVEEELLALLQDCDLQVSDIGSGQHINFYGIRPNKRLFAAIGIEKLQKCALLRSLAVAKSARGTGYAKALVMHAEQSAKHQGFGELYLLTDSAVAFFEKADYRLIDRAIAPPVVKETEQFSNLCAQTSALMYKKL